jgi:hypothetical protein
VRHITRRSGNGWPVPPIAHFTLCFTRRERSGSAAIVEQSRSLVSHITDERCGMWKPRFRRSRPPSGDAYTL